MSDDIKLTVDGVAVEVERHRYAQAGLRAGQPQRAGDGERPQHVRGVEMAERQPVAQGGPGRLTRERDLQPLGPGEAQLRRRDHGGGVGEGDVSEGDPHPSRSAAVTIARAMSTILRFSFIACRRRSL